MVYSRHKSGLKLVTEPSKFDEEFEKGVHVEELQARGQLLEVGSSKI